MLIRVFRERWLNLARENGLLRFVIGALCATVALQGCHMKKLSERTTVHVHAPEYMQKDFSIGADKKASLSYTEQWALSLLPFIASFTPETVDFNVRQFLLYVHPESYNPISGFLLEKSKEIKTSGVAQAFFPKTVEVTEEGALVVVSGRRTRIVGNVVTDQREVGYSIRFELGAKNRPLITELTEDQRGGDTDEP